MPHHTTPAPRLFEWFGLFLSGQVPEYSLPATDSSQLREFLDIQGVTPLVHDLVRNSVSDRRYVELLSLPDPELKLLIAVDLARHKELGCVVFAMQELLPALPLIFKGQALAHTLYSHSWQRPRADTDLLIDEEYVPIFLEMMETLGYQRATSIDGNLIFHQTSLYKTSNGIEHNWDLHWKLSNRPAFAELLTYSRLTDRAREVTANGVTFLVPSREDDLLIACLHLIGHHWHEVRLIWLYDIFLLTSSLSSTELERFAASAKQNEALCTACHQGLSLTQKYIPNSPQATLIHELGPGLGAAIGPNRYYGGRLLDDARALGFEDKLRFVRQHAFPSPQYMTSRFGIRHRWQLPFWYVFRIGRALPKLFKRR